MQISIRRAELNDMEELRRLSIDAFVHAYASFNTEEDMTAYLQEYFSYEKIRAELSDESLVFLLAFTDRLTGYVKLDISAGENCGAKHPVEIARLYSDPAMLGLGIGKQLMRAVEAYAREHAHDAIWLGVWQKNFRAVNFYQREGFRIYGLTQFRLGNDLQDDFLMVKPIAAEK